MSLAGEVAVGQYLWHFAVATIGEDQNDKKVYVVGVLKGHLFDVACAQPSCS